MTHASSPASRSPLMHLSRLAALLSSGLLFACTPSSPPAPSGSEAETKSVAEAKPAAPQKQAAAPSSAAASPLLPADLTSAWRAWLDASSGDLAEKRPDLARAIGETAPQRGRDGQPRLAAAWLDDPDAGPLLFARLLETDDRDLQVALAWALAHGQGIPMLALADLATAAGEATVRSVVTAELWRHDDKIAVKALAKALGDADPRVRTAAATASARHPQGEQLAAALAGALADEAPEVRWVAARSLGAVGGAEDAVKLEPALDDAHPKVRRLALRALASLDRDRARALVAAKKLTEDPDPKVARAAENIARP